MASKDLDTEDKAVLLACCVEQAFALIETLLAPTDIISEDVTFDTIKTVVLGHLRHKTILHFERHLLHSLLQKPGEDAATFMQRLKDQANKCNNFAALKDDLTLSQFIFDLADQSIREK